MYKFEVEQKVTKIGGSYQASGTIKARFLADDGTPRYVFRFDSPSGLLHIFNEKQLENLEEIRNKLKDIYVSPEALEELRNWSIREDNNGTLTISKKRYPKGTNKCLTKT